MRKRISFFCEILILCLLVFACVLPGSAGAEQDFVVSGKDYVLPEDSNFDYSKATSTEKFFYGATSLGTLHLKGAIEKDTKYNGRAAYGAKGDLSIQYAYNGAYQMKKEEYWHVEGDGTRWIRDYDLGFLNNIAKGCIMIEKSPNASSWEKVIDPLKNYFDKARSSSESLILTIPESDYKNGMYYRVVVAYKFAKRTKANLLGIGDEYDRRKCVEVYEFYVSSEKNYVTISDLGHGYNLKDKASTDTGFMIRKNGSQATVTVNEKTCKDFDYFSEPGKYGIVVKTKLGKEYNYTITVTNGLDFTSLKPKAYESEKDKGFPLSKSVTYPVFGSHLTSLSLATPKGSDLKQDGSNYGITGDTVSLYLKLNQSTGSLGSGWELSADTWGKNKKQQVYGVETGEVGKGALIVQTSSDGRNWKNVDKGRYEKGLYTTDYAFHYGSAENVLIYTPSGQDVLKGIHIRVLFAYQVKLSSKNEYRDYVEVYQFYLCYNDLGAVTFHNLSVTDTLKESFADADQNEVEVYQKAETLVDGSYTTTGFRIDKTGNPTVKHTVLRDGVSVKDVQGSYDVTGKYDITLTSAVGSTRKLTIYVDRIEPEEAIKQYFGEGFISGKRIFSEGEYPVYEGGEISYYVASVGNNVLPLYGKIKNLSTGSEITIEQNSDEKTDIISEPGNYQAIFATSEKVFEDELAGDARVFTFRFLVIAQGTAPGPVVNRRSLDEYSHSTVTDSNPVYYGLTYLSAEKGKITLAFASKEAAVEYAYKVEEGLVERQENGEYRYSGAFVVDQNIKYESAWDLTENLNRYAEAAVHKHFFNMSDEFTYLSMTDEDLEKYPNLRQLELPRSVTIFGEDQKEKLTDIDALPLLNDKPYAYLDPATGKEDRGFYSFKFVTDQYGGIDSKNVMIIDSKGEQHVIRYSESVGQQLLADNCPSGIVTIREETMYGDTTEYQAVYIAPDDNQTKLTLEYIQDENKKTAMFNGSGADAEIVADSFTITELSDPLDPYAFVIVKHNQKEEAYTAKESIDTVWSEPGKYSITCLNRMGYGYTVPVTIVGSANVPAEAMITPEITERPTITQKPENVEIVDGAKSEPSDEAAEQTHGSESMDAEKEPVATPEVKNNESEGKKTGENSLTIIIIAGLILIAVLGVFAYRRIKLFSRAAENLKSGEGNKNE